MNLLRHLTVSNEGIEFQNGAFFKELVLTLGHFPKEIRSAMKDSDFAKLGAELDKVIKRHTGLSTNVMWEHMDYNAYVIVPFINVNSAIFLDLNQTLKDYEEMEGFDFKPTDFLSEKGNVGYKVNPKTSMVTGSITKEIFSIALPRTTYINGKWSDEELTAVLLHEVGHIFSMLECLDKTVTTNAILTELDARLRKNPSPKERDVLLTKAAKEFGFENSVVENAKKTTDNTVVMTIYVGQALETIRSQSGNQFFDINTWEALADQFAVRHGAGKSLSSAIDKIYSDNLLMSFGVTYGGTPKYMILEILKLVRTLSIPTLFVAGFLAGSAALMYGGLFLLATTLFLAGSGEATPTYNTAFERMTRMRQQLVEHSKRINGKSTSGVIQRQLLQDVAAIDEVLKNYHDRQSWLETLGGFLFSSVKTQQLNVKFQKQLEALALNDLYLQSLSLKNL